MGKKILVYTFRLKFVFDVVVNISSLFPFFLITTYTEYVTKYIIMY